MRASESLNFMSNSDEHIPISKESKMSKISKLLRCIKDKEEQILLELRETITTL
jgi:hypothetical protein